MKLLNVKKGVLEEVDSVPFKKEKEIQELVESNVQNVFGLIMIQSEFSVGSYRIDTLCFDEQTNAFVIIEYKRGSSYSVIDQGFSYYQLMMNNRSDFILALSQHLGKVLNVNDVSWPESKILFVAPSFNNYQKDSVNFKNLPFELWTIQRFSNNTVVLNRHQSNSKAELKALKGEGYSESNDAISTLNKEVKSYTFEDHFSKSAAAIVEQFESLMEGMEDWGDIEFVPKGKYISLMDGGTTIAYFNFRKKDISIELLRGNEKLDGSRSKNFFTLNDPESISETKQWVYRSGVKGYAYIVVLNAKSDVEYFNFLLKQKYNSLKA